MIAEVDPELREERLLEGERREVEAAMALVAGGRVLAVIVANLAHCRLVVEGLRARAREMGIELELLAHPSDPGCDVSVRLN